MTFEIFKATCLDCEWYQAVCESLDEASKEAQQHIIDEAYNFLHTVKIEHYWEVKATT